LDEIDLSAVSAENFTAAEDATVVETDAADD
jgi:hypothetical protein